ALCARLAPATPLSRRVMVGCRIVFGLCAISFGLTHFEAMKQTAEMVPGWIPGSGNLWAVITGVADVLAGVALVAGIGATLAARMLTLMFGSFGVLIWIPILAGSPTEHQPWAGNGVNLSLIAAAWVIAD